MRVALLYPEVYDMARFREKRREFPPFGVLYLASAVRQGGHEVRIVKVTKGQAVLDLTSYDAVGFSLASSATYGLMLDARRTATISPGALIMAGGVHANFYPDQTLADFDVDVVSSGESDETILDILGRASTKDFAGIPGTVWRDSSGTVRRSVELPLRRDISDLPLPSRDLLDVDDFVMDERLAGRNIRMAHSMFSRGCPFPCNFCAAGRTRIQYRNGVSARTELEHLIENYGVEGFAIVDDNFIVAKEKVRDICTHITDLDLHWSALSRVDTVDQQLLSDMSKSGCIEVKFGVESGSEPLLKAMNKNTTQRQIRDAITMAADVGIEPKAFIIHGYPGENDQTTDATIELLDSLAGTLARVSLFRFVPLPGTSVYNSPLDHQIRGTHLAPDWDGDWEKFHIHHNDRHWWGSDADFAEVETSYQRLRRAVEERFNLQ